MKELIAKVRVPYNRRYYAPGERFEAKDKHAHVLVTIGKCAYAPVEPVQPAKRRGRPPKVQQKVVEQDSE